MEFEYGNIAEDRECVAFIHSSGTLIIKNEEPTEDDYCQVIGGASNEPKEWWHKWMELAQHKFYKGDKITITF